MCGCARHAVFPKHSAHTPRGLYNYGTSRTRKQVIMTAMGSHSTLRVRSGERWVPPPALLLCEASLPFSPGSRSCLVMFLSRPSWHLQDYRSRKHLRLLARLLTRDIAEIDLASSSTDSLLCCAGKHSLASRRLCSFVLSRRGGALPAP